MEKLIYSLLISTLFILASCKNQTATQESVTVQEVQMLTKTEGITDEELEILSTIKSDFDSLLNIDNTTNRPLANQYQIHLAGLKSSFFKKEPITLNLPYNNKLRLSKYDNLLLNSNLWSFKCGYNDEDGSSIVNFYCLNTSGPIFDYLQNSSANNLLIQEFIKSYVEVGDFTPSMQQNMILNTIEKLDFTNPDHQMFWVIYHISLNETMNANKAVKTYRATHPKTPQ